MDIRTRFEDFDEVLRQIEDNVHSKVQTNIPCIVEEDSDGHTVKLRPAIKGVQLMKDGSSKFVDLPIMEDVPIQFAGGGKHVATHPVKKGDEVMASISSRALSGWHQSGGTQAPSSADVHSLSHAVCQPGLRSDPKKLEKYDPDAWQARTVDGEGKVHVGEKNVAMNRKNTLSDLVDNGMTQESEKILINCS